MIHNIENARETATEETKKCWVKQSGFKIYQCRDGVACHHDAGIKYQNSNSGAVGPCGQQHCWYGCFVCVHNNQQTCGEERDGAK